MILILSENTALSQQLKNALKEQNVSVLMCRPSQKQSLANLYDANISAAIVDDHLSWVPEAAWLDMLVSLNRRLPVIVMTRRVMSSPQLKRLFNAESISVVRSPSVDDLLNVLDAVGVIGMTGRKLQRRPMALYNPQMPVQMLEGQGALSVIYIDASAFRKIAIEYGNDAYRRVQECFAQILYELWGNTGSFRASDLLARRSLNSDIYYIFLEPSRINSGIPAPGVLERLSDRIWVRMQNAFWREIFMDRQLKILPDCITYVPEFAIGFATTIFNPCVDSHGLVDQLLDVALEESKTQFRRMRDRQKELMQALIKTPKLLTPNFQAIFNLQGMTKEMVTQANAEQSLKPVKDLIYGFESLIRVQHDLIKGLYERNGVMYLDSSYMRPDVLFGLSHASKLTLELDQACLYQAISQSNQLPGTLFVNILPRNLYHIDRLEFITDSKRDVIFEVSESEAINNLELMTQVRENLEHMEFRIAADDFGKGHSGLEQIIKIKPDLIKLDRSLIQNIHSENSKRAFVNGIVEAARIAKTMVLAEGVELWEEAAVLQGMGVQLIQGFLIHKPQAAGMISEDLELEGVTPKALHSVA